MSKKLPAGYTQENKWTVRCNLCSYVSTTADMIHRRECPRYGVRPEISTQLSLFETKPPQEHDDETGR